MARLWYAVAALLLAVPMAKAQDRIIDALDIVRACAGDVRSLCGNIAPGDARIKACMKDKLAQLSPACFDAILTAVTAGKAPAPDDAAIATVKAFGHLRGMRYCEVFLIGGDAAAESLSANFFNTTDLNNSNPKDTCPPALWAKVDPDTLKQRYAVLGIFKNGPRGWATDRIELPVGDVRDFDGLKARWMGNVALPKNVDLSQKGSSAYKPTQVQRKSSMTFEKGRPIFILDDPDGLPWVMQAYSMIVDPKLTYDDLATLGSRLRLAPGWKFRTRIIDQDLTIRAVNGVARIVQDDLENTYDACFDTACSFKP